ARVVPNVRAVDGEDVGVRVGRADGPSPRDRYAVDAQADVALAVPITDQPACQRLASAGQESPCVDASFETSVRLELELLEGNEAFGPSRAKAQALVELAAELVRRDDGRLRQDRERLPRPARQPISASEARPQPGARHGLPAGRDAFPLRGRLGPLADTRKGIGQRETQRVVARTNLQRTAQELARALRTAGGEVHGRQALDE